MGNKIIKFIKDEVVFCVATVLALVSAFVVPPSAAYVEYIDFRVLALLFCLMLVVSGLSDEGVFQWLMGILVKIVHNMRQLAIVLVMACFLLSMWITNDVALITFVPFAIMVLGKMKKAGKIAYIVVLQTVAANLGSMCTPIGNPQNLYLYTTSGMSIGEFLMLLMPYTVVSLVLILVACFLVKPEQLGVVEGDMGAGASAGVKAASDSDSEKVSVNTSSTNTTAENKKASTWKIIIYGILFVISILTVLDVVHYLVMLGIVVLAVAIVSPKLFKGADYILLLTFVAFFVLVGNIKNIEIVNGLLGKCVAGNEVWVSVIASQVISNVPAAVLLSGFSSNYAGLMVGTNIGGLGTIIASMASLISYKFYGKVEGGSKAKYMGMFTLVNVVFLAVLLAMAMIII